MKKTTLLPLFLFFQFLFLNGFLLNAQNLLQNPGFEGPYGTPEYPGSAVPYFYNPNWNGNPASNVTFSSSTMAHSGAASQKIAISTINGYCYYAQKITVKGPRILKASVWIKADSNTTVEFSLRARLVGNNPFIATKSYVVISADGWQKIEIIGDLGEMRASECFVKPNTSTELDFFINFSSGPNNVYIDDASVIDVTNSINALPNLLKNSDFEGAYQTSGLAKSFSYNGVISSPNITFGKDISNHHSGDASQKIAVTTVASTASYTQSLRVPQNRVVKASIWVMATTSGTITPSFNLILRSLTPTGTPNIIATQTNNVATSAGWQKFEIIGNLGMLVSNNTTTDNLELAIQFNTRSTFYIDDATVQEVTNTIYTNPNLLVNTEFEGEYGTSGENLGCASPYLFNPGWNLNPSSVMSCSKNSLPAMSHSGATCQQINVSSLPAGAISHFLQGFTIPKNKTIKATVWVKSNSSSPVTVEFMLRSRKAGNPTITTRTYTLDSAAGWQMLEIIGNTAELVDPFANNIDFLINFKSIGDILVDDAYVSDVTGNSSSVLNLLTNANFEDEYGDLCLANPYSYNPNWESSSSIYNFSRDTENPHTGKACQKIEVTTMKDYFYIFQGVNVKGRRTFKGIAWVRSTAANPAEIDFTLRSRLPNDPTISSTRTLIVGTEWQKIEIIGSLGSYPVTDNQNYIMEFFINLRKPGVLYIDDVSITDVTDEINKTPLLTSNEIIPAHFFGLHINQLGTHNTWPSINFGMLRLWDSGTKWSEVQNNQLDNPNNPTNDDNWYWDSFEAYVNKRNLSVTTAHPCDIIYTLGISPSWASSAANCTNIGCKSVNLISDWQNYVQKIVSKYGDDIKYWEIWNEVEIFFSEGTNGVSLLDLARSAYTIIKGNNSNNVVLSPNFISSKAASDFIYKCNGNYPFDVFSFHQYTDKRPENEIGVWYGYRNMLDNFGMNSMPMWNTEGSNTRGFEVPAAQHDISESQGAVSRAFILQWAYGIKNFNWYFWEPYVHIDTVNPANNDIWADKGTELSVKSSPIAIPTISIGGTAYKETVNWLVGKQMINKKVDINNTWTITLFNPTTTKNEFIVWNADNLPKSYTIPVAWGTGIKKRDLTGLETAITTSSISVNAAPILIVPSIANTIASRLANKIVEDITVYPNPNSGIFSVNIDKIGNSYTGSIYNIIGQIVSDNLKLEGGSNTINLKNINTGVYFLRITDEEINTSSIKFIVK